MTTQPDFDKAANECAVALHLLNIQRGIVENDRRQHVTEELDAINRIMASGDNPQTGKPHSASSAEKIKETDEQFCAWLDLRAANIESMYRADLSYEVARARLWAIALGNASRVTGTGPSSHLEGVPAVSGRDDDGN